RRLAGCQLTSAIAPAHSYPGGNTRDDPGVLPANCAAVVARQHEDPSGEPNFLDHAGHVGGLVLPRSYLPRTRKPRQNRGFGFPEPSQASTATGIRTPVSGLRIRRPSPLD